MITENIIKFAIGDKVDYENPITRTKLGSAAGIVGIISNLLLTFVKASIGLFVGSISIVADALNNLTDMASAVVSLIGIKISGKAKDKDHPYGHGRGEYIATLIVAFAILFVGLSLLKSSVENIIKPDPVEFDIVSFIILILSIGVKYWMFIFYNNIAKKINSSTLKASAVDSLGDVLVTSVVVLSFVASRFTKLPIDGFGGLFVSLFILKSGYDLIREMIFELLGAGPSEELKESILDLFASYNEILDTHDLNIHDYGTGLKFATIDAVVSRKEDICRIHEVFTEIEHEVLDKHGLILTVHMDLDHGDSTEELKLKALLDEYVNKKKGIKSYHDQVILNRLGETHIMVHLVIDGDIMKTNEDEAKEVASLKSYLSETYGDVDYDIIIDKKYF